jgi:hypothetical protein
MTTLNLSKTRINLGANSIGDKGCMHLSLGKWENLVTLDLGKAMINLGGNRIGNYFKGFPWSLSLLL